MADEMYVALLRGINVGGKNKLPMRDLAAMFGEAGCRGTRTYIQSGNVIFMAPPEVAVSLPHVIAAWIAERFGYSVPVILRTAEQMEHVVRSNPFLAQGVPIQSLHVMFLDGDADEARVASLDPERSPGDEFRVAGSEIYLHFPNGMARTKLTNDYFDRALGAVSTARNWRTVTTLYEMMQ